MCFNVLLEPIRPLEAALLQHTSTPYLRIVKELFRFLSRLKGKECILLFEQAQTALDASFPINSSNANIHAYRGIVMKREEEGDTLLITFC